MIVGEKRDGFLSDGIVNNARMLHLMRNNSNVKKKSEQGVSTNDCDTNYHNNSL